jgi:hypothetical protein
MSTTQTAEEVNKAFVKGLRARMSLAYAGFSLRNTTLETKRGRYWEEYYAIARQECKEIMEEIKDMRKENDDEDYDEDEDDEK